MSSIPRSFIIAVAILLIAASASAAIVSGTVSSADPRRPLGGMVVAAYDAAGTLRGTATTDATGLYVLSLPAGSYRVLAYDPAGTYATSFDGGAESYETSPVRVLGATDNVRIDFTLVQGGVVTGIVQEPSGALRANAIVAAYNLSGTLRGTTLTNAQGAYAIVLPPGQYKLVAYDEGGAFAATFYRGAGDFVSATPVSVTAARTTSAIDIRLRAAARVFGSVVDSNTSLPVGELLVFAYTENGVLVAQTTTDANGAFRFSLAGGRYRFVAADPARRYANAFYAGQRSFAAAEVVTLVASASTTLRLVATRGGIVAGRVTGDGGAALAGITVVAYNPDGSAQAETTTDAQGRYELTVAPGDVRVAAFDRTLTYATRFHLASNTFFGADAVSVATGQRVSGYDFALERAARRTGTVTDAATGQRLPGIAVAAYDESGVLVASAATGDDGRYVLVVPSGTYRILAFDAELRYSTRYDAGAPSYDQTTPRNVAAAAEVTADFALARGIRVNGTVRNPSGDPLTGIEVFALDAAGDRVAAGTSRDGQFAIVLPAGSYHFRAVDPTGRHAAARFDNGRVLTIAAGQTAPTLSFTLTPHSRRRSARH
jgi:hypothetical protein